ncbi:hypothetical protein GCM10010357_48990 [Streptomyces luteireticuli]|uniref:WD40 repeat domain-containing protein n=1 Tax=Streptomyces luteireticuli TaxID=173858 RepID=A0ABN0YYL3_9ACTN
MGDFAVGSTARTVLVPAATVVTLLAGLTACGSGSSSPDGPSEAKSSSSPRAAGLPGGPIPGLAKALSWTVPATPGGASVFALGDAFAVVSGGPKATRPASGTADADAPPAERAGAKVVQFRDAGTGRLRATVERDDARVYATTWHGAPSLRVDVVSTKASDGMTSDRSSTVSEVYDARGGKLGSVPDDKDHELSDGWVATDGGGKVAPAEGGEAKSFEGGKELRSLQAPRNPEKGRELPGPRFGGGYGFSREEAKTGPYSHTKRLVVTELSTGRKAWTSSEAGRPDKAIPEDRSKATNVVPVTVLGDRVVLAWQTEGKDGGTEPWLLSVNDLRTGRLLTTGPVVRAAASDNMAEIMQSDDKPVFYVTHDPSTDVLTVSGERDSKWQATAWDLKSGKQLWTQADDENLFAPVASGNGVVYGFTDRYVQDFSKPIAVDVKTKKVLARGFEADRIPVFSADGHGAVAVDQGVFVFAKG